MTCDDNQGQHITEACRHVGIRIPEEVAVLGVDNDEMICDLSDPPLSSIALDVEKGGYDAAKLLDHMIKHGTAEYLRHYSETDAGHHPAFHGYICYQ
jgi:LacI family transcriptional regulator